ncbi:acetylxylan esterase, partial [Candidatus Saccharibacteria bacterium SW_7_54_9]
MLAALDDRITTAVPTAGITDLRNYILDGRVANHCDCMFMINTYRWDFPMVAALAAPRPMLLANGDHDPLFPIDGVRRLFSKTRQVYGLYEKLGNWNRLIVDAPHEDVPPLRQETYRWMHRHLKDQELTRMDSAKAFFDPVDLKVFDEVPADEINTRIDELFVEPAPVPDIPKGQEQWQELRESWRQQLKNKTFRGWPDGPSPLNVEKAYATSLEGLRLSAYDFNSQPAIRLRLWLLQVGQGNRRLDTVNVSVVGEEGWQTWASVLGAMADRERAKELVGKGA